MEQRDRDTIQRNIKLLASFVHLDALYHELISRGVIDHNFVERIKLRYTIPSEQAQEFFLRYTKRGPEAFDILVESLRQIGHISEANALLRSRQTGHQNHHHHSPQHFPSSVARNGHSSSSPTSSVSPSTSSSTSLPNSPLMRAHSTGGGGTGTGRVEPFSNGNSPSSASSSSSLPCSIAGGLRRLSLNSSGSISFADQPPLVIRVKKAQQLNNGVVDPTRQYTMQSNPRGFALIINNIEFLGDSEARRDGAEKDTVHLQELLEQLGFEVMVRHNVRKMDLINTESGILKRFIDQFRSKSVDSCIVAIMSHGKAGHNIRAHDPEDTRDPQQSYWNLYEDILPRFNNRYCPILNGKPKMFIIQACLGGTKDRGVRRTQVDFKDLTNLEKHGATGGGDADWDVTPEDMPEIEDMIILFATIPGFVSNRDIEHGTWYIQSLCRVFMDHAHNTELVKLLQMLGWEMRGIRSEDNHKQMCSYHALGFHKDLYFNPGIFEDSGAPPSSDTHEDDHDDLEDSPPTSSAA